jgi:hypothetical protein
MVGGWIRYMVQLLNLVVHKLSVPALHNLGFAVDANSFSLNFMLKTVASVTKSEKIAHTYTNSLHAIFA